MHVGFRRRDTDGTNAWCTREGLQRLWSEAGFRHVETTELTAGASYDGFDDAWFSFSAGAGVSGAYCRPLDDGRRDTLRAEFRRRLNAPRATSGCRRRRGRFAAGKAPAMDDRAHHARTALEQVCARGDLARARELYSHDFVDYVNTRESHGQEGIARSVALYRGIFEDLRIDVVASRWLLHGTHRGRGVTLPGSPSAGSRTAASPRAGPSRTTTRWCASSVCGGEPRSPRAS